MLKGSLSFKLRKLQVISLCVTLFAFTGCGEEAIQDVDLSEVESEPIIEEIIEEEEEEEEIEEEEEEEELEDEEELEEDEEDVTTASETDNFSNVSVATSVTLPSNYQEKFANWYSINQDIKGWIKLEGTKLDYPVMQTTNNEYYLNRNAYKQSDVWGVPYMWTGCTTDVSTNTVLFGHSRDLTGEQFSALKNYRTVDFYKANPVIEFDTVYADGDYKILAYFIENTSESRTFFRYHEFNNQTDPDYINNFIAQAKARSYINTTVDYLTTDKFLTISTCEDTNSANYNRLVLVARKVRPGESSYVDTSGATQNSNQILP